MASYRVTWVIDIEADSPVEAALIARRMQSSPDTTATFYDVRNTETLVDQQIDLSEMLAH